VTLAIRGAGPMLDMLNILAALGAYCLARHVVSTRILTFLEARYGRQ
jgi:hypothetical protein